ncbi:MAG: metal-dependent transcriptional regulator [Corynebacterium sp.]|nr:metal-dependent transcriptional regulator [Corynebacterium sp.]
MNIGELSPSTQDYLKAMWNISEWSERGVQTVDLATTLQVSMPAISAQVKKLAAQGLLTHARYGAITLTATGQRLALEMVRRHRLIETFLVNVVGCSWDEVHDDAELLEHAISDTLLARIDALLDHPTHDPHGDPIPRLDGTLPGRVDLRLHEAPQQVPLTIVRVHDADATALRALAAAHLTVGSTVTVLDCDPVSGAVQLQVKCTTQQLEAEEAGRIRVIPQGPATPAPR